MHKSSTAFKNLLVRCIISHRKLMVILKFHTSNVLSRFFWFYCRDTTFATGRKSLRDFVLYFPCEATGNSHPNCKGRKSNLASSFRRSPTAFKSWRPSRDFDKRKALDYVSKRDPPENFEHWLDFAQDNRCITGSYSRIEKDLEVESTAQKRLFLLVVKRVIG